MSNTKIIKILEGSDYEHELDLYEEIGKYFSANGVFEKAEFSDVLTSHINKYVSDFNIIKPENQRSRGDWSYYLSTQETLQVLDDLIQQEAGNPEFRIQKKRGGGIGLVISLKD